MAELYYQSPDLYIDGRTNYFAQVKNLCGSFVGYIQENSDGTFLACPVDGKPLQFDDPDITKKYLFGEIRMQKFVDINPETIEYHSKITKLQLTLF